MKKLLLLFAAIAITAGAYAQADSTNKKMNQTDKKHNSYGTNQNPDINTQNQNVQNNAVDKSHPDGVMMQNGKMMKVKDGQMTSLQGNDMTMSNGTKIMSDGTCISKDGKKTMMKEGQHMDMSGTMVPMKTNQDKNMYLLPDSTRK